MGQVFQTLGTIFGGGGGTTGLGGGLGAQLLNGLSGPLGIMQAISQMSLAGKEKSALDQSIWWSKNPTAISGLVNQLEQPLSKGLTSGVGNVVNASLAEQGLSQAPGIQSQVMAQALAPYQQNEQQMAITEALKAIGLPSEALANIQSVMNPSQLALMLKSILPQRTQPTPNIGNLPGGGNDTGWNDAGWGDENITWGQPSGGGGGGGFDPSVLQGTLGN